MENGADVADAPRLLPHQILHPTHRHRLQIIHMKPPLPGSGSVLLPPQLPLREEGALREDKRNRRKGQGHYPGHPDGPDPVIMAATDLLQRNDVMSQVALIILVLALLMRM